MTLGALPGVEPWGLQSLSYSCSYVSGFLSLFRVILHIGQQEIRIFQEVFLTLKSLSVRRIRPTHEQGFLGAPGWPIHQRPCLVRQKGPVEGGSLPLRTPLLHREPQGVRS